ncbi:NUDIX hydrolase [Nocardioides guangzhouensis]|uniref:NUDIX hydrolase n=1 Tax=Nocardioides guangzhouensis TaxID=2497878 RepID=A0A4Q4ZF31_9ACTN|nr:NUDIX hydrolase [Nocardioides guangzhouensis]RYP86011.1 NUDIX hydrolase [Nocardioides guangzhouensis]
MPTQDPAPDLRDEPEGWPVVASTDLHRDHWVVALRGDEVTLPTGGEAFRRIVLEHPGSVIVLGVDEQERVYTQAQYRHPVRHRVVELPAGLCDVPGEDPVEVARRELLEEAALVAEEWTHLLSTWSSPGLSDERIHIYLARGLRDGDRGDFELVHEEALLEARWVPFDELLAAVLDGRVADGPVVQAVLAYEVRRDELTAGRPGTTGRTGIAGGAG